MRSPKASSTLAAPLLRSDFRGGLEGSSPPYRPELQLKIRLFSKFLLQNLEKVLRLRRNFMVKPPLLPISRPAPVYYH